ncbi:MAG TPA: RNA 2'-phosphotransferase [Pseudonocardiaceae bacterium]|nr:RNA 2'-phosphotransferase [Pseudonocardiaceae bacterium]
MRRVSKRLSYHLRHAPERIGIELDPAGWVEVTVLLDALAAHGLRISRDELSEVVAGNDKQRFAFDSTGTRIRASQGHSVAVDLGLRPAEPPSLLYHGTVARFLPAIRREGLRPMGRQSVHLSAGIETALAVGARRGDPVVLTVAAGRMFLAGHEFRVSDNGVWLVGAVPLEFLSGL